MRYVILGTLKSFQERRRGKDQQQCDEEGHFGQQIAATLRRFTPRQKALAKLQIEQVLFSVKFPPEETFYPLLKVSLSDYANPQGGCWFLGQFVRSGSTSAI